jgi:uncharacterized membrane-anchored protein YhcB (DUF1043 family)
MATGAVVGFLLNKTDRLLMDEVNLQRNFRKELEDLKKELERDQELPSAGDPF